MQQPWGGIVLCLLNFVFRLAFFAISSFRLASSRYFVFSPGVFSLFRLALFCLFEWRIFVILSFRKAFFSSFRLALWHGEKT